MAHMRCHQNTDECLPHLRVVPVAVQGAIPLLAFQDAVVHGRLAIQATADPQGLLQVPGKHLPLPTARLVPVHVVVLGAAVLVEEQGVHCHVLDQLQQWRCVCRDCCYSKRQLSEQLLVHSGQEECCGLPYFQAAAPAEWVDISGWVSGLLWLQALGFQESFWRCSPD